MNGCDHSSDINKGHGDRCTCRLLAEAMGYDPATLSFSYCRSVLQRHWVLHCNHGGVSVAEQRDSGRWGGLGEMDAIKAILIKNE